MDRAPSARDLREAISVTAKGDQHQIEVQLGHLCNNTCLFCVSGQMTQLRKVRPIELDAILGVLEEARGRGVEKVTFLGGEPTIQRSFLPALRRAVELGFKDIVLFTNLVRGREPRFLEEVCSLGTFTWRVSIQGGDAASHDLVVGRAGAFAKIEQGLAWLSEAGQDLTANACINEDSYRSVGGYLDLVQRYGLRQLHLDMVRPNSVGVRTEAEMAHMLARYEDIAEHLGALLDGFDAWNPDFEVNVGNLPFCLLPRHAHRIAHGGEETLTVTTSGDGRLGRVLDKYAYQQSDRVFADGCDACVFRPHCRGVAGPYAALYGTEALVAVAEEDPRIGQAARRFLETGWRPGRAEEPTDPRVERTLRHLLQRGPYAGWRPGRVQRRAGGAELALVRDGAELTVQLTPQREQSPKVSFDLGGVPQDLARPPVEAVVSALRARSPRGARPRSG